MADLRSERLVPPTAHLSLVARDAPLATLRESKDLAVTVVSGPAGYGKACLLSQHADQLRADGEACAWLNVDPMDRDPAQLSSSIACALRQEGLIRGRLDDPKSGGDLLTKLRDDLSLVNRPTLFLNDCELLAGSLSESHLQTIIGELHPKIHFVVATRHRLPAAFARFYGNGLARQIKGRRLRFDQQESALLFGDDNRKLGAELCEIYRGWPVALGMVARSVRGGADDDLEVASDIADYVDAEILDTLPDALRAFLIETSILDFVSAESARDVCGLEPQGQVRALTLALDDLLEPKDAGFAVHPRILTRLREHFEQLPADRKLPIQLASAWRAAKSGDVTEGVSLASSAGAPEVAAEILNVHGAVGLWSQYGLRHMANVLAKVPKNLVQQYPRLRLAEALAHFRQGQVAAGRRIYEQVRVETQDFSVDDSGVDPLLLQYDASCTNMYSMLYDDIVSSAELVRIEHDRRYAVIVGLDQIERALRAIAVISYHQRGEFKQSDEMITLARKACAGLESTHHEFFLTIYAGWNAFVLRSVDEALGLYRSAAGMCSDDRQMSCLSEIMVAEALFERGDIAGAQAILDENISWLERSAAYYDFLVAGYGTAARLALRTKGKSAALAEIERARALIVERESSGLERMFALIHLEILMDSGDIENARAFISSRSLEEFWQSRASETDELSWRERSLLFETFSKFYMAIGDLRSASKCIHVLRLDAERTQNLRSALIANLLSCALLWRNGGRVRALSLLADLLDEVFLQQRGEILWNLRHALAPLLRGVEPDPANTADQEFWRTLLGAINGKERQPTSYELSEREAAVLRLVLEGESNKAIARQLRISENTVKYHLKRITSKMKPFGRGRIELAQRARADGLLPVPGFADKGWLQPATCRTDASEGVPDESTPNPRMGVVLSST